MKSKFYLVAIIAAVTFAVIQSGKSHAQTTIPTGDEGVVECEPTVTTLCVTINAVSYYGKPKTS